MKKILSLILALVLILSLAACGAQKSSTKEPDGAVTGALEAIKAFDMVKLQEYLKDAADKEDLGLEEMPEGFGDLLKDWAKEIKYTLGKATVDGDKATVPAQITYVDASDAISEAFGNYIEKAMSAAFSGEDISEEEMTTMLVDSIKEAYSDSKDKKTSDVDVEFELENIDGEWKIVEMPEEMGNVLTANFITALEDMLGGLLDFEQ